MASLFMLPEIVHCWWYVVPTTEGDYVIPADLCGPDEVASYVPSRVTGAPVREHAWGARLSAPGYLDATEWTTHATEAEAWRYLESTYDLCSGCHEAEALESERCEACEDEDEDEDEDGA